MPRLVRTAAALDDVVEELSAAAEVALDTEFHSERHYYPDLMLIQMRADEGDPILVDPLAELDLGPLAAVLAERPVIVHGGASDVEVLARRLGVAINVTFDTQIAAGCAGLGFPTRLQTLTSACLGLSMLKGATLSDWSLRPLSEEQLSYAADDVLVLAPLKRALEERLDGPRARLAAEFTAEMNRLVLAADEDDDAWQFVNGAHLLDGPERGVLRELASWRQKEARARDVPRHAVAGDAVLLDTARRAPRDVNALRANRRLPTNVWKRDGPALVACVKRAVALPPPPPPYSRPRAWIDLVRAAGRVAEANTGVAAELLLPDRVIAALARGSALPAWRHDALGREFSDFLHGKAAIVMPEVLRRFTIS